MRKIMRMTNPCRLTLNSLQKRVASAHANGNGKQLDGELLADLIYNATSLRSSVLQRLMDPRRDIDQECGYPKTEDITEEMYWEMWERNPIAARVCQVESSECWKVQPNVFETEDSEDATDFERAWDALSERLRGDSWFRQEQGSAVWEYLVRADILSGVGSYGVILLGLDDGKPLNEPAEFVTKKDKDKKPKPGGDAKTGDDMTGVEYQKTDETTGNAFPIEDEDEDDVEDDEEEAGTGDTEDEEELDDEAALGDEDETVLAGDEESVEEELPPPETERKLLFMRCFPEHLAKIESYEQNPASPRYGQPLAYSITLNDPRNASAAGATVTTQTASVHWTRVIHLADNLESSEIIGTSRMRTPYNRLLDLNKLYPGSAEMYYRGAFPGYSIESASGVHPGEVEVDTDALKNQMEQYMNSLQRYMSTVGMTVKSLAPQVVDPTPQIKIQLEAICILIGIPMRIFMGSERGELASGQDDGTWENRLNGRRETYLTPRVIVPLVDRLISLGVLPEPADGYRVDWPAREELKPLEEADIASKRVAAMAAYIAGGVNALMLEIDFLTRELGYDEEDAKAILDAATVEMEAKAEEQAIQMEQQQAAQLELAKAMPPGQAMPGQPPQPGQPGGFPPKKPGFPPQKGAPGQFPPKGTKPEDEEAAAKPKKPFPFGGK